MDLGVIGLERIYNGEPKFITLINPKNLDLEIKYFDNQLNIVKRPIDIGEYKVVIKNKEINITKKLVIRDREEVLSNNLDLKNLLSNSKLKNNKKKIINNVLLRLIN